jgi:hypothetical protein
MELSIPILYENKPVGTLTAEQDGLYTVYAAVCAVPELRRLRRQRHPPRPSRPLRRRSAQQPTAP